MKDLIDPVTGQLLDFDPRQGDPPGAFAGWAGNQASRRRWGRRVQLVTPGSSGVLAQGPKTLQRAVLVTTEDLGRTFPISTIMRFASPILNIAEGGTTGEPVTFSQLTPYLGTVGVDLRIIVRRTADERSSPSQDTYVLNLGAAPVGGVGPQDMIPFDVLEARHLSIEAELVGPANQTIWVDAVSTIVDLPSTFEDLTGYSYPQQRAFAANIVTPVLFLPQRNARRQAIFVNTSTDSELRLFFTSAVGSISPITPNIASIVLPPGGANTYETPIGGYNGAVVGLWFGGTPNGFALVTEGISVT